MSFTWKIWGPVSIIIHLIDVDPSDGNVQVGIEIRWAERKV